MQNALANIQQSIPTEYKHTVPYKKLKKEFRLHRKDKHSVLLFSLYYTDHKYLFYILD